MRARFSAPKAFSMIAAESSGEMGGVSFSARILLPMLFARSALVRRR